MCVFLSYVCIAHVCLFLRGQKRPGVIEQQWTFCALCITLGPPEEYTIFLTTEPDTQAHVNLFKRKKKAYIVWRRGD